MKKVLLILILFTFFSCEKDCQEYKVIKGCEGQYLRKGNLDYSICNKEKLENFENGTSVKAKIELVESCIDDGIYCLMVHPFETADGKYKITKLE